MPETERLTPQELSQIRAIIARHGWRAMLVLLSFIAKQEGEAKSMLAGREYGQPLKDFGHKLYRLWAEAGRLDKLS